jgi:hypothetical protein
MSQLSCAVWGHDVDNHRFCQEAGDERRCRCGTAYLGMDGTHTHVRHTLSCFLGHHTYTKLIERDGHTEYVCVQCGHPLLFEADRDPHRESSIFKKKVRYLLRAVRSRCASRRRSPRLPRVRLPLRPHISENPRGPHAHHAPGDLRRQRAPHQIRHQPRRIHGVRVPGLRAPVLFCRADVKAGQRRRRNGRPKALRDRRSNAGLKVGTTRRPVPQDRADIMGLVPWLAN